MADTTAIPASFEEAKELARRSMLAARAEPSDDATQAQQRPTEEDADPAPHAPDADDASPSDEDEPAEPAAEDDDDEVEDDEAAEDSDDGESDDDEAEADSDEPPARTEKRKPSRRSKKIATLQDKIARLEADSVTSEDRLLARLRDEQARTAALEDEQRRRQEDDRANEALLTEYLGSDEEYRTAVRAALNGDPFEAEKAKLWDERREVYGRLSRTAEARVNRRAAEIYHRATGDLPGVDKQILQTADFETVLKHLHAAGSAVAVKEARKELDKKDARIARLEADLKAKSVKRAATAAKTPAEGGTPVAPKAQKSIYEQAIDPVTRTIDRNKFAELRRRAEAAAR